jgi:hypothetical protein
VVGLAVLVVLVAACTDSKPTSSPSPSSAPTGLVAPGTPIGNLTLAGDPALSGPASVSIRCDFPELDGQTITVLGTAADGTTQLIVDIGSAKLRLRLYAGTGTDYHERVFEGPGVLAFDGSTGAKIDSTLTEVTPTRSNTPGQIGAATALQGTFDCNGQTPGSTTITLTGDTAEGRLDGVSIERALVECNTDSLGNEAIVLGVITVGPDKLLVSVELRVDGVGVSETLPSGALHKYRAPLGTATISTTDAHVSADVVEQDATPPHTLHVEGDAKCGSR